MNNYIITLQGETPSKKNSRINTRSGRSFPSKRYTEWHSSAMLQIMHQQKQADYSFDVEENETVKLIITFYHGDYRRRDSDNQLSSILDLLVDMGILLDDSWRIVPQKEIIDKYEKDNPHCTIEFRKLH
jgi:Holliday junction resolvase RusA-like endonuclease